MLGYVALALGGLTAQVASNMYLRLPTLSVLCTYPAHASRSCHIPLNRTLRLSTDAIILGNLGSIVPAAGTGMEKLNSLVYTRLQVATYPGLKL